MAPRVRDPPMETALSRRIRSAGMDSMSSPGSAASGLVTVFQPATGVAMTVMVPASAMASAPGTSDSNTAE